MLRVTIHDGVGGLLFRLGGQACGTRAREVDICRQNSAVNRWKSQGTINPRAVDFVEAAGECDWPGCTSMAQGSCRRLDDEHLIPQSIFKRYEAEFRPLQYSRR